MIKYVPYILAVAIIIVGFTQWRSCNQISKLQQDSDHIKKQKDSLSDREKMVLVKLQADSSRHALIAKRDSLMIDSLKSVILSQRKDLSFTGNRIQNLIRTLHDYAGATHDSSLKSTADSLLALYNSAVAQINFMNSVEDDRDGVIVDRDREKDSIIAAQAIAISNLKSNYEDLRILCDRLQADLDKALKSHKRSGVIRTIAEIAAAISLLLILK